MSLSLLNTMYSQHVSKSFDQLMNRTQFSAVFHILNNYKGFLQFDSRLVLTPATVYLTFKFRKTKSG